jgi:hypothetical protein
MTPAPPAFSRPVRVTPCPDVIPLCVRWYCRYSLSYRELEEMMRERGLSVDHVTIFRWGCGGSRTSTM